MRVLLNSSMEIDTEIQLSEMKIWADRSLFYLSKMFAEQIEPGQKYSALKKCVSISILDFILFPGEAPFYSRFHIREDTRGFVYTDKMELSRCLSSGDTSKKKSVCEPFAPANRNFMCLSSQSSRKN